MDSLVEDDLISERYTTSPWGTYGRTATFGIVSLLSKLLLNVLNTIDIEGLDDFHQHTMHRKPNRGLITVSNHTSTLDDPCVISAMIPWSYFLTEHQHKGMRWSLCARELCYKNPLLGQFFQAGKTLPVERGQGISQPIMRVAASEVAQGQWLHIFPEGRINYTGTLGKLRWGIGKIVCDAVVSSQDQKPPIVLPFYHSGMGKVMPRQGRIPRLGHAVHVVVGQPVELDDLTCNCSTAKGEALAAVYRDIAHRVAESLTDLERRAVPNPSQLRMGDKERIKRTGNGHADEI